MDDPKPGRYVVRIIRTDGTVEYPEIAYVEDPEREASALVSFTSAVMLNDGDRLDLMKSVASMASVEGQVATLDLRWNPRP